MPVEDVEKMIRKEPLEDFYDVGSELGRGKFAIVKRCTSKATSVQYAVKVLKKRRRGKSCREEILVEIDIMRQSGSTDHVRIVKLYEVFESSHEFHLVIELATGGELFRKIAIDPLPEDKAREVVYQILDGVQHLHTLNIVHLDLKPENILLCKKNHLDIKIADFGLAVQLQKGQEVRTLVGTAEYVAPEILNFEPVSTFSDMWSIGALTYALLTGYSPFQGETHQETFLNVSTVDYDFDDEVFEVVSQDAKDFVEKLLIKQPSKRLTAPWSIQHSWMQQRKSNNLNSSTSSLDSALCMDSASSMEPSPVSSASSSFSPAPSTTITRTTNPTTAAAAAAVAAASSTINSSYSQPEDMRKVNEKLTQISTLATERLIAEAPLKPRAEDSPTSTDSSTSTLRDDDSIENIAALISSGEGGGQKDSEPALSSSSKVETLLTSRSNRHNEVIDGGALSSSFSWSPRPKVTTTEPPPKHPREPTTAPVEDSKPVVKISTPKDIKSSSVARESLKRYKESLLAEKPSTRPLERTGRDNAFSRGLSLSRDATATRNRSVERNDKLSSKSSSTLDRSYSLSTNKTSTSEPSSSTLYEEENKSKFYSRLATKDITSLDLKTVKSLEKYQKIKKSHHARPHTPEPETLPISEGKIQQVTEHRTRRKSEGMSPAHQQRQEARPLRSSIPSEATVPEGDETEAEKQATDSPEHGTPTANGTATESTTKTQPRSPTKVESKSPTKSPPPASKYMSPATSPELKSVSPLSVTKKRASPVLRKQTVVEEKENEHLTKSSGSVQLKPRAEKEREKEATKNQKEEVKKEPPVVVVVVKSTRGRFFEASTDAWERKTTKEESIFARKSPERAIKNSLDTRTCRLASPERRVDSRTCSLGGPDQLNVRMRRERSPVSDRMKQVKSNRRKTPVISMEALNDILAGNIPDVDENEVIGFSSVSTTTATASSISINLEKTAGEDEGGEDSQSKHLTTLEEEEDEFQSGSPPQRGGGGGGGRGGGARSPTKPASKSTTPTSPTSPTRRERKGALKSTSPTSPTGIDRRGKKGALKSTSPPSPTSQDRKLSAERKVTIKPPSPDMVIVPTDVGESQQRSKKLLSPEKHKSKSLSSASPERDSVSPPSSSQDYDKTHFDPFTSSMDRHGGGGGLGRLRANSLVMSRSTPDLTQLLGDGKREAKAKKVGRSNSRRLLGRSRLDSYVTTSSSQYSTSNQHSSTPAAGSASPSVSKSSSKTLPGRFLSGSVINKAFSSFRSRDSGRDKSGDFHSNRKY